jgi:hypothetical protein
MTILSTISVAIGCVISIFGGAIACYEWGWARGYDVGRGDGANDARLSPLQRHPGDPPPAKPMGHC